MRRVFDQVYCSCMVGALSVALADVLMFPVWWYTDGLLRAGRSAWNFFTGTAQSLMIDVWLKNIFVPMFGRYDWQSRLISFVVRVAQVIARSVALLACAVFLLAAMVIYLVLPVLLIFGFVAPWL